MVQETEEVNAEHETGTAFLKGAGGRVEPLNRV
jgi:hypothetical protein